MPTNPSSTGYGGPPWPRNWNKATKERHVIGSLVCAGGRRQDSQKGILPRREKYEGSSLSQVGLLWKREKGSLLRLMNKFLPFSVGKTTAFHTSLGTSVSFRRMTIIQVHIRVEEDRPREKRERT